MGSSSRRKSAALAAAPVIRGYLPVRLKLPPTASVDRDETFFYIKEHQISSSNSGSGNNKNRKRGHKDHEKEQEQQQSSGGSNALATLFVCNAPVVPPIQTKLLLKSLFERFGGTVRKVTVVENPRQHHNQTVAATNAATTITKTVLQPDTKELMSHTVVWTEHFPSHVSFLNEPSSEGKYAHVEFESVKHMKMAHESDRQRRKEMKIAAKSRHGNSNDESDDDDDDASIASDDRGDDDKADKSSSSSNVLKLANRYRSNMQRLINNRSKLMEECNAVMEEFEDKEKQAREAHERSAKHQEPDEDGFVTVSYANKSSAKSAVAAFTAHSEFETVGAGGTAKNKRGVAATAAAAATNRRKKGQQRSRKKKQGLGSQELQDFYRFQAKDRRKRTVHELRERFEEDLEKVKRLKESGQYQPFK